MSLGDLRHPLPSPAREIRHRYLDITNKVELGLQEQPPAAGAPLAVVVAASKGSIEVGADAPMGAARPRLCMQLAIENLTP
jgi:hypothetical protein